MQQKVKRGFKRPASSAVLEVKKDGYIYLDEEAEKFLREALLDKLADVNSRWKVYKYVEAADIKEGSEGDYVVVTLDDRLPEDFTKESKRCCYDFQKRNCIRVYVADIWDRGDTIVACYDSEKSRISLERI